MWKTKATPQDSEQSSVFIYPSLFPCPQICDKLETQQLATSKSQLPQQLRELSLTGAAGNSKSLQEDAGQRKPYC